MNAQRSGRPGVVKGGVLASELLAAQNIKSYVLKCLEKCFLFGRSKTFLNYILINKGEATYISAEEMMILLSTQIHHKTNH